MRQRRADIIAAVGQAWSMLLSTSEMTCARFAAHRMRRDGS